MLDSEQPEDLTDETAEVEVDEAESEAQAPEESAQDGDEQAELTITLGEEDPDDDAGIEEALDDKGKRALARLREVAKENARKARELAAELAAAKAEKEAVAEEELVKPVPEAFGYNMDRFEEALIAYHEKRRALDAKKAAAQKAEDDAKADFQSRLDAYTKAKSALRVPDFEDVEDVVRQALTPQQQSIILRNSDRPEQVIYALGKSPKALSELAKVKDFDRFAFQLAKLEGAIKVSQKSPPPPESKLKGGNAAAAADGNLAARIDRAKKAADASGDYTEYFKLRRLASGGK